MQSFRLPPNELPAEAEALRQEVRDFLTRELADHPPVMRARSWAGFDPDFSKKLARQGWIGMTWPKQYGGGERSYLERYVLLEELLTAGAPVSAHWTADRQSGPLLLRYGTQAQRDKYLPEITRGDALFCIGMSEPDSGSDLASVRTKAIRTDGGYIVNGTKVWTSGAHRCDYMIALLRTDPEAERKHDGLSQFIVHLKETDGITIRPIMNLIGEHHFNEVVFEDAFVPEECLVGAEGDGWKQVTSELGFERSGPERYLSSYILIQQLIDEIGRDPEPGAAAAVGRVVAQLATLRQMSISVASQLDSAHDTGLAASVVKDLGTTFEQSVPDVAQAICNAEPTLAGGSDFQQVLAYTTMAAPSFSLRGGAREILRGIIARGLGLR